MKSKKFFNLCRFTFIELMVVLFIILMLLSFLVPSFKSLQKKGDEIYCVNNYKQIASLLLMYSTDYDGRLPSVSDKLMFGRGKKVSLTNGWQGKLTNYLVEPKFYQEGLSDPEYRNAYKDGGSGYEGLRVFVCREAARLLEPVAVEGGWPYSTKPDIRRSSNHNTGSVPTSYSGVDGFFDDPVAPHSQLPKNESTRILEIKRPEEKIVLIESSNRSVSSFALYDDYTNLPLNGSRHAMTKEVRMSRVTQGYLNHFTPNFIHDDVDEFWLSTSMRTQFGRSVDGAPKKTVDYFHKLYGDSDSYFAFASRGLYTRTSVLTHRDPQSFDNFIDYKGKGGVKVHFNASGYFSEEIYQYMTGNMNILFADMHVSKKSDKWLGLNWEAGVKVK